MNGHPVSYGVLGQALGVFEDFSGKNETEVREGEGAGTPAKLGGNHRLKIGDESVRRDRNRLLGLRSLDVDRDQGLKVTQQEKREKDEGLKKTRVNSIWLKFDLFLFLERLGFGSSLPASGFWASFHREKEILGKIFFCLFSWIGSESLLPNSAS